MPHDITQFSPTPSLAVPRPAVDASTQAPASATALGFPVTTDGQVPSGLRVGRAALEAAGFDAKPGETLVLPAADGPVRVAVGAGPTKELDGARLRDAVAAFGRVTPKHTHVAVELPAANLPAVDQPAVDQPAVDQGDGGRLDPTAAAQAVVEGVLLARYRYEPLRREREGVALSELTVVTGEHPEDEQVTDEQVDAARTGARRGLVFARATALTRDLANTPHSHLTATRLAEVAVELGTEHGVEVEVFDQDDLVRMGCGGLLAVNAGSAEPPRLVKLTYRPTSAQRPAGEAPLAADVAGEASLAGHAAGTPAVSGETAASVPDRTGQAGPATGARLALVGKGITYDSGGLSLKPSDWTHAHMKTDMSGAAAVLAAMLSLGELGCTSTVTGYMVCTDNMPSGTATALGDVITVRGGTTVEVIDTDAEGRLVLADGLRLAAEERPDAIVDVATLTGSVMRALGPELAGVLGTDQTLVDQVRAAGAAVDEPLWQLPLVHAYRRGIDSQVADLRNVGSDGLPDAIMATLFLAEFVADVPWAHVDIAGVSWLDEPRTWRAKGATGFGTRLLLEIALGFGR